GIYTSLHIPIFLFTPLKFLVGPVYYMYSLVLIGKKRKLVLKDSVHFIPFLLCFINYLDYYLTLISFYLGNRAGEFDFILGLNGYYYMALEIMQTGIYVFLVFYLLKQTESRLRNHRSGIELIKISWLKKLNVVFILYQLVKLSALYFMIQIKYEVEIEFILALSLSAIIYFIGYNSINLPEVFTTESLNGFQPKYEKSSLTQEQISVISKTLTQLMDFEKPYLKPDLKLSELASLLSVSSNHLSQYLNQELKTNFYDYINYYRIEEAKKRLIDPENTNYTILAIAYDSGFSSKASFNRIFKKHTGTTPSNYNKSELSTLNV
ncbi:MAG: helix-turn-helix domain-containing protein, partial [Ignavibacteriaceae bacterium]